MTPPDLQPLPTSHHLSEDEETCVTDQEGVDAIRNNGEDFNRELAPYKFHNEVHEEVSVARTRKVRYSCFDGLDSVGIKTLGSGTIIIQGRASVQLCVVR